MALPWAWSLGSLPGTGAVLQVSGACLLVMMVGWPLAVWSLVAVAAGGAWLGDLKLGHTVDRLAWFGIAPATVALLEGVATRRWLPEHVTAMDAGVAHTRTRSRLGGAPVVLTRRSSPPG